MSRQLPTANRSSRETWPHCQIWWGGGLVASAILAVSALNFLIIFKGMNNYLPANLTHPAQTVNTKAVIHMGPHKTGTSSIQFAAGVYSKQLQQDGFDTVCSIEENNELTREFSSCFLPPKSGEAVSYPCNRDYLLAGSTIASKKRNLFVSAEDFAVIGLQWSDGVDKLSTYLSQWDEVSIVVYYRHYFAFLGSKYNQRMKNHSIERGHYNTIQDYMLLHQKSDESKYTVALVERLKRKFGNIVVMDMHDQSKGGPAKSFFCHSVSLFPKTCDVIRSEETKQTLKNSSIELHFIHLLAGAVKAGFLSQEKASARSVETSVKRKVNEVEEARGPMKMKCLMPETLQEMWEKSLRYRRTLFRSTSRTITNPTTLKDDGLTEEELQMKSEFELAAKSSLCMVDVDDALSTPEWKEFFESI